MKILSITTATNHLSVALNDEDKIWEKNEEDHRNHSEHLDPLINELLKENNLTLKDIDRFAVAEGPGSYTGLRIGITTAKMFASILNKDLVGVSTLAALANGASDGLIVSELDARNKNFFAGVYRKADGKLENLVPDGHYHLDDLMNKVKELGLSEQVIFVGSSIEKYQDEIKDLLGSDNFTQDAGDNQIHASEIGKLALNKEAVDPDKMVPKYLRRTQAEMDWHNKTGKAFGPDSDYVEEV